MENNNGVCLEKLHSLELKIALEIRRICEKYNIQYFIIAGTLLGAVRHGGFIPWDDDMDIGMLRSEYERFLKACEEDLSEEFFLQTWDTDPEYPMSYGKIRLKNTHVLESFSQGVALKYDGLFVDIFPYDSVPENPLDRKLQAAKYFICKRILWIKKGMGKDMRTEGLKKRIKYDVFKAFSSLFSYEAVKEYLRKTQIKYNGIQTKRVVTDGADPYEKESIERCWAENLELIEFENEKFLTYKDKTDYLTHLYGDYMKLPPEDQRGGHNLVEVDFGEYA